VRRSRHLHEQAGNRLFRESSPYLLLHAGNPMDWYPWCEEAFTRACEEGRPIFLSIGYSACYWCHVMEREVFSDPEIAALMNRWFVNVKGDREERPDVDEIYLTAAQVLAGSAGWPAALFLTPELTPFVAGSYLPPEDRDGVAGFPTVARRVHNAWSGERRAELEALAGRVTAAVGEALAGRMVVESLRAMGRGAIHDQLGDGVHRYTLDREWRVPHFEKMLYDNALLGEVLAAACRRRCPTSPARSCASTPAPTAGRARTTPRPASRFPPVPRRVRSPPRCLKRASTTTAWCSRRCAGSCAKPWRWRPRRACRGITTSMSASAPARRGSWSPPSCATATRRR
jgi:uncharacterized protein YyaL (SSP411 family)